MYSNRESGFWRYLERLVDCGCINSHQLQRFFDHLMVVGVDQRPSIGELISEKELAGRVELRVAYSRLGDLIEAQNRVALVRFIELKLADQRLWDRGRTRAEYETGCAYMPDFRVLVQCEEPGGRPTCYLFEKFIDRTPRRLVVVSPDDPFSGTDFARELITYVASVGFVSLACFEPTHTRHCRCAREDALPTLPVLLIGEESSPATACRRTDQIVSVYGKAIVVLRDTHAAASLIPQLELNVSVVTYSSSLDEAILPVLVKSGRQP